MFGVGDFWLEIRVIIKILIQPCYPRTFDNFIGDEAKKIQNGRPKKTEFFKTANSQYFFTKILEIGS
jgi:hypothetical protein